MRWIKTNEYVYNTIWLAHNKEFTVFGAFTCVEGGSPLSENPHMMTEWGFKDSEFPLMKNEQRKESRDQKQWDIEYFLAAPTSKDC